MRKFRNKKAAHNFYFLEEFEAGIALKGTEIKSIRTGKISFKDSYARVEDNEVWLYSLHISPYSHAGNFNHEPERKRKLLLHKREIRKLRKKVEEKGMTLVPKEIYINEDGMAKVVIALAKGKKVYDKREVLQKKDQAREMQRKMKYFN
jgi:SsrA-binding protein